VLTGVAAAVTLLFTIVFPSVETRTGATLTVVGCILLLALAVTMARLASVPLWLWTAYPFVAIAVIAVLDLTSKDATVTAQIFFVFPALYAGAQLRRRGAVAVCVAAAAADLVVTLALLPAPTRGSTRASWRRSWGQRPGCWSSPVSATTT